MNKLILILKYLYDEFIYSSLRPDLDIVINNSMLKRGEPSKDFSPGQVGWSQLCLGENEIENGYSYS